MLMHVELFSANEMNYFYLQSFIIAFINIELLIAYSVSPLNERCVVCCSFREDTSFFFTSVVSEWV